jgi:hypothetical protein
LIDLRVLVVDVKSLYPRHTGFVFPVFNNPAGAGLEYCLLSGT